MVSSLQRLNAHFAQLEATPPPMGSEQQAEDEVKLNLKHVSRLIQKALEIRQLVGGKGNIPSREDKVGLLQLERNEMALKYRSGQVASDVSPFEVLQRELSTLIKRYKANPNLYPGGDGSLTAMDEAQIEETCLRFPEFAKTLLLRNSETTRHDPWTVDYVKFCLRSPGASGLRLNAAHWIKIFVEYPNEVDQLKSTTLDKRLGAINPQLLDFQEEEETGRKVLCMKIDGRWEKIQGNKDREISLLNRVTLSSPAHRLTIQEIYRQMREKKAKYYDVEVFSESGITLWDTANLGSWNPVRQTPDLIDLNAPRWIESLPIWRIMDMSQLKAYFPNQIYWGSAIPHQNRFGLVMSATRGTATLEVGDNHGFFYLIIPEENEKFRVLPCGFQPEELPQDTILSKALMLMGTQKCIFHYCDESAFRSDRQRAGKFVAITPAEFLMIQEWLKNFIQKSREGKEVFQATGRNCAKHAQKCYDRTVGQRFYQPFIELATRILPEEHEIQDQIKQITKGLNDKILHALSQKLATRLIETHNYGGMAEMMALCFNTFSYTLNLEKPAAEFNLTKEDALRMITGLYEEDPNRAKAIIEHDLPQLFTAAIESQQFYKLSVFKASLDKPVLGPIFKRISKIQNEKLRLFCYFTLSFLLAPWRSYTYLKKNGYRKTVRLWSSAPYKNGNLFLPAQLFEWEKQRGVKNSQMQDILTRFQRQHSN